MEDTLKDPLWLFDISNPRSLLVVAHPDDETIFAAGLILSSRETEWTIVCCTDEGNRRHEEFLSACNFLAEHSGNSIKPVWLGIVPEDSVHVDPIALAKSLIPYAKGYNIVFTHNKEGEYGNEHHKMVHRCVSESICNPNTWTFISPGSINVDQKELISKLPNGNFSLDLSSEIRRLKIQTYLQCHGSQARQYWYDPLSGEYLKNDLTATLSWEFKDPGREYYSFFR